MPIVVAPPIVKVTGPPPLFALMVIVANVRPLPSAKVLVPLVVAVRMTTDEFALNVRLVTLVKLKGVLPPVAVMVHVPLPILNVLVPTPDAFNADRSEERRVGKECRL